MVTLKELEAERNIQMLNELNSLINIRNFLNISINDLSVQMSSEKSNAISKKISLLNKRILDMALELDVEAIYENSSKYGAPIARSSMEIKTVEELDKIAGDLDRKVKWSSEDLAKVKLAKKKIHNNETTK